MYVWEIDKLFKQIHFSKERLRPQKISRNFDAFNLFFFMLLFLFLQRGALMPEPDQMSDPSQVQAPPPTFWPFGCIYNIKT